MKRFEWEQIYNNGCEPGEDWFEATYRAKVPGGWLIRHEICCNETEDASWKDRRVSMVFVEDPPHRWEVEKL